MHRPPAPLHCTDSAETACRRSMSGKSRHHKWWGSPGLPHGGTGKRAGSADVADSWKARKVQICTNDATTPSSHQQEKIMVRAPLR
jgi:hypothetical protein